MLPNQSHLHRQQTNHPPLYAAPPYHHQFTPAPSTFFHHAPNSSFSNTQHLQPAPPQGNIFQQNYAIPTPRQTTQPSNQAFKYPPAHTYPQAINPPLKTTHRDWRSSLHSVYISNLSRRITKQGLKEVFDAYGKVRDVFISNRQSQAKVTTFAFVRYKELREMDRACTHGNGRRLDGHYIVVKKAEYGWDQRRVLQSSLQLQPPQQQASFNIEILQEIFAEEGYQCVSKPMGGKNVLLTFCLKEDLKACTEEHRAWLNLWFESIVPWKNATPPAERLTWLRVDGVPINLWTEALFSEIGEQCGSFIMIDEDTYHRRRYDFARMLISVKKTTVVPTSVTFKANGGVYKVHVKEKDVQDIPKPHSFGGAPTTSHPLIQTKQHSDSGQQSIGWDLSEQQGSSRAACKTQSEHCTRTDSLRTVHLEPIKTRSSTTTAPPINLQNKSPTHASSLQSPPYHQLSSQNSPTQVDSLPFGQKTFLRPPVVVQQRYILTSGIIKPVNFPCSFLNIYAPNCSVERASLWVKILELKSQITGSLCVYGDFNIIKTVDEKTRDNLDLTGMAQFSDFINDMNLIDIPLSGGLFTWTDNREAPTKCRLDRFLISSEIILSFPAILQKILSRSLSDHNPITLIVDQRNWGPKPFRLFFHWLENKEFVAFLKSTWDLINQENSGFGGLFGKMKRLKLSVKAWQQQHHAEDGKMITILENDIDTLEKETEKRELSIPEKANHTNLKSKLWHLYKRDEQSWLQKSRLQWTKLGDRNTKFFHITASNRRRKNSIHQIQRNWTFIYDPIGIKNEASMINCKVGALPTNYLRLPLGANLRPMGTWQPIIDKFNSRLAGWKGQFLSMGGRLTLINSVLSSLPLFYLSIFRLPTMVKQKLEAIQRNFLWFGSSEKKKIHYVNWSTVSNPKTQGGLGIIDLELKSRALLNKWLWRYANEPDRIWRQVVSAKNKLKPDCLIPIDKPHKPSSLWNHIMKPMDPANKYHELVTKGFAHSLDKGTTIRFWEDFWVDDSILATKFPRIYVLAISKKATIAELGSWVEGNWRWDVKLRRQPFSWEQNQWRDFTTFIKKFQPHPTDKDIVVWKKTTSGLYTSSSFIKASHGTPPSSTSFWKNVWIGYAPLKVETFCWQTLHGKIATKFVLMHRRVLAVDDANCSFCTSQLETLFHVLFHCTIAWKTWSSCCCLWGITWVQPGDVLSFFKAWFELPMPTGKRDTWRMLFFATLWTLWLCRNEVIFRGKSFSPNKMRDIALLRHMLWCRGKWELGHVPVDLCLMEPLCSNINTKRKNQRMATNWSTPPPGTLKLNTDGAAKGKPELAGISLFFSSPWAATHSLVVESDSANAINWAQHHYKVPWRMKNISNAIETFLRKSTRITFKHVMREANKVADELAKAGVLRDSNFKAYFQNQQGEST
ncbi:Uncharacterized protein TCM_031281 [Theobroma cacao]|uniref:RRM domain-containing protein n=1 Tax=Theobroma cacao TaxID=3641 RepID=A0A061F6T6_THECC|nr:Uncharacterized protein TCM_031281 [Theobroma cacao]